MDSEIPPLISVNREPGVTILVLVSVVIIGTVLVLGFRRREGRVGTGGFRSGPFNFDAID
jgi:hypothetical protein